MSGTSEPTKTMAANWPADAQVYKLFDTAYYVQQVGEVDDPLAHYRTIGCRAGRNPHPLFDTSYYLRKYASEIGGESDPLTHFFASGAAKWYETHPLFDVAAYLDRHPELAKSGIHPVLHYLSNAFARDTHTSVFFDVDLYVAENPGVVAAGFAPLTHYIAFGWRENLRPHRDFDIKMMKRIADAGPDRDPYSAFVTDLKVPSGAATKPKFGHPVDLSIIILNFNKSLYTLQCLHFIQNSQILASYEVIIVDNGSTDEQFSLLAKYAGRGRIVRLSENRFFGEANNIGVEEACGRFLLFLNNDAFVTKGAVNALLDALARNPKAGAVGPKFLYLDGQLQEAGAMMSPDGTAVQLGKWLDPDDALFNRPRVVDYCSAAALLVRKHLFDAVLGFDLCWDPAYYEDADLCLKLRLLGAETLYEPKAVVHHVENGTSSDKHLDLKLHDIVGLNRYKFVSRWSRFLDTGSTEKVASLLPDAVDTAPQGGSRGRPNVSMPRQTLALYTPYKLVPGGGERYLLSLAMAFSDRFRVTLLTPERNSRHRLITMGRELDLDLQDVELATWGEARVPYDVFIAMGNEVLPPVRGIGRLNLFHCQFPFPLHESHYGRCWGNLATYAGVVVNSRFTATHYDEARGALGLPPVPITILSPPVPQIGESPAGHPARAMNAILHVGRFASGGHCKRQDALIVAFQAALRFLPSGARLRLAGSLSPASEAREYLAGLQSLARGSPVSFHINPTPEEIRDLYWQSGIYWHATGMGEDVARHPERCEHFGITVAEAMSAGLIPVVLRHGGPGEIVNHDRSGFLVDDIVSLAKAAHDIQDLPPARIAELRRAAVGRAADFSFEYFKQRAADLIEAMQKGSTLASALLAEAKQPARRARRAGKEAVAA